MVMLGLFAGVGRAAAPKEVAGKVIFDTDIGDDIDDAYALGLLLRSPEVDLLGVTTTFKDTHLRARLAARFLADSGRGDVPVYEGPKTPGKPDFSQGKYAAGAPDRKFPDAIGFVLDAIRKNPGQITLVAVGPLSNVGALIAKDPETFRKLKRVVMMGGSVAKGYDGHTAPDVEWNIRCDIAGAKALFGAGVPIYMMPLDSTVVPLDREREAVLFGKGTGMAKALAELTAEWDGWTKRGTPVLFDAVAAGYAVRPEVCPVTAMRIVVDDQGYTRRVAGKTNAYACLGLNEKAFYELLMGRVD